MRLLIKCNVPFREEFVITFNGESQIVNEDLKSIYFEVSDCKEYDLEFEHKQIKKPGIFVTFIIFILTSIIQGIINIIFWNTDSDWKERIIPYCLSGKIKINLVDDKSINLKYKYIRGLFPKLYIDNNEITNVKYFPNIQDFNVKYLSYFKKILSILIVNLVVLNAIFFSYVKDKGNTIQSFCIIGIESVLIIVTVFLLVKEYIKLKKLKSYF